MRLRNSSLSFGAQLKVSAGQLQTQLRTLTARGFPSAIRSPNASAQDFIGLRVLLSFSHQKAQCSIQDLPRLEGPFFLHEGLATSDDTRSARPNAQPRTWMAFFITDDKWVAIRRPNTQSSISNHDKVGVRRRIEVGVRHRSEVGVRRRIEVGVRRRIEVGECRRSEAGVRRRIEVGVRRRIEVWRVPVRGSKIRESYGNSELP